MSKMKDFSFMGFFQITLHQNGSQQLTWVETAIPFASCVSLKYRKGSGEAAHSTGSGAAVSLGHLPRGSRAAIRMMAVQHLQRLLRPFMRRFTRWFQRRSPLLSAVVNMGCYMHDSPQVVFPEEGSTVMTQGSSVHQPGCGFRDRWLGRVTQIGAIECASLSTRHPPSGTSNGNLYSCHVPCCFPRWHFNRLAFSEILWIDPGHFHRDWQVDEKCGLTSCLRNFGPREVFLSLSGCFQEPWWRVAPVTF